MARRKKLQKAFALLLTFSMLMSLLSVTALAAVPVVPDVPETHTRTCTTCMGSGTVDPYDCPGCEAAGTITCPDCDGTLQVDCTACEGGKIACGECTDGKVQTDTLCSICLGEGTKVEGTEGTEGAEGTEEETFEPCTACEGTGFRLTDCGSAGERRASFTYNKEMCKKLAATEVCHYLCSRFVFL